MSEGRSSPAPGAVFFTTRWTMVMQARGEAPEAKVAMGELCEAYWMPVYRFLCREGRSDDQSRELTQAFFAELLAGGAVDAVDPRKGRFRCYLLGALKHFLSNQRRSAGRQKRGGDVVMESLDSSDPDLSPGKQVAESSSTSTDAYFDRHWALAVVERGLETVYGSFKKSGKIEQFEALKPWLMGDTEDISQQEVASKLGITPGAMKVAIHRLRQKFGDAIRQEIAETVDHEDEIAGELSYLIEALHPH